MRDDEEMMMIYHNRFVMGKRTNYDVRNSSECKLGMMENFCTGLSKGGFNMHLRNYNYTQLSRDCG